jgi:acyl-phosphate glycerol 3-phosphate acyltransferase
MHWLVILLTPLAGYLIGSIPFGYLVARARGVDIFQHGSGNIGATNVGRVLGRPLGILVFVLDFAKGAVPVLAAQIMCHLWPDRGLWWQDGWLEVFAGLAAFLGHLFPLYLGLRGGKGVATGTGVALVLLPGPALAALLTWVVAVLTWRYVSVASILAVFALTAVQFASGGDWTSPRSLFCLLAGALVIVRHRSNIVRLLEGRENQIRENPAMNRFSKSLHVLALSLWFGAAIFFSFVVGPSLFGSFDQLGESAQRPRWFPRAAAFSRVDEAINGPREQGSRAAGYAITPMFLWYFLLQAACGFIALATALPWARLGGVHRWRLSLLLTAVALVIAGWPIERYVDHLRDPRNQATEAYLRAVPPTDDLLTKMQSARAAFGMWHGVSLLLNLATIVFVAAATALAAHLPSEKAAVPETDRGAATPLAEPLVAGVQETRIEARD